MQNHENAKHLMREHSTIYSKCNFDFKTLNFLNQIKIFFFIQILEFFFFFTNFSFFYKFLNYFKIFEMLQNVLL